MEYRLDPILDIDEDYPPDMNSEGSPALYSLEAEMSLLGAILIDPGVFPKIDLELDDFHDIRHKLIWRAIRTILADGGEVTNITVGDQLESEHKLAEAGGPGYLAQLINSTSFNTVGDERTIKEYSRRRQLLKIYQDGARSVITSGDAIDPDWAITRLNDLKISGRDLADTETELITQCSFVEVPSLPEASRLDPVLGLDACKWLDDYVDFSLEWSPRAYKGFHEACALWLLSTVAARRVYLHMGKPRYTNLYLALTARTSLYAKSTTAEIALQTIRMAGLSWLLAADSTTPQKFISDLTTRLVPDYDNLSDEQKDYARLRVGTAGQRGWFYDEFGQHVASMMRDNGFMADFRGLLRRLDDTPERYEYGSIGCGSDIIERPYLALLASITPDDLRPFAKRGSALWGDGFLARFALITPPEEERRRDRFPKGERIIPANILTPLVEWHKQLGLPQVNLEDITDEKGKPTGVKRVEITHNKTENLAYAPEVYEAFYAYDEGLLDILQRSNNHDLDGNYARLSEKALRIAALLASISEAGKIELNHWARALDIVERWRAGLHHLYSQINEPQESQESQNEEKLLSIVLKLGTATAADCKRYAPYLSTAEITLHLDKLEDAGLLSSSKTHKGTKRYKFL
jgi:hypothetical protein